MRFKKTSIPRPKEEPTVSKSSPRENSRRACLCRGKDTYSIDCCDGYLQSQGIGGIYLNTNEDNE